jgi:eukaryotic-like serine/threonine-protein kinase
MSCIPPGWSIDARQMCEDRSTTPARAEWLGPPPAAILHGVKRMPSPQLTDALADRYAIERELGRGGMATVYLAQEHKHARQVAIKVLHAELAA